MQGQTLSLPEAHAASPQAPVRIQRGEASFLSNKFHGRRTANGERYSKDKLTAAHKTLPFGTVLRVTRLSNGRMVLVRVNDRGPFIEGRLIDLSLAAAKKLNMMRSGVTRVQFEIISDTQGVPLRDDEAFYLAFYTSDSREKANKAAVKARNTLAGKSRKKIPEVDVFERIWDPRLHQFFAGVGPFFRFSDAQAALSRLPDKIEVQVICARVERPL